MTTTTDTADATRRVAAGLARDLVPGDVVALEGELGAGKTVFARGVAEAMGVEGPVTSPTFTLINEYRGPVMLYHMDLYRLDSVPEIEAIGIEEYLYGDGICLVEWAEKLGTLRPPGIIRISIVHGGGDIRHITIEREEAS